MFSVIQQKSFEVNTSAKRKLFSKLINCKESVTVLMRRLYETIGDYRRLYETIVQLTCCLLTNVTV